MRSFEVSTLLAVGSNPKPTWRSREFWVFLVEPSSLLSEYSAFNAVPIDHTDTAPATPTNPPAPLSTNPSISLIASALTSTSFLAVTTAPLRISAPTSFFSTPTLTAPPTPTNPPAIAPVKLTMRDSLAAPTYTP